MNNSCLKNQLIIISAILLLNCTNSNQLKIQDLKFPDVNEKSIRKNNVKEIYKIAGSDFGQYQKNDTISILKYNIQGKLINEYIIIIKALYSYDVSYQYDSLNLVSKKIHSSDFTNEFDFVYELKPDSLLLYQKYKSPTYKNISGKIPVISGTFKFNKQGYLIEKSQYENNDFDAGRRYITQYTYDSLHQLLSEKKFLDLSIIKDSANYNYYTSYKNTVKYYYTDQKIDSAIQVFYYLDNDRNKTNETYRILYDNNGLIKEKIRDSIHIFYKHNTF
ncbi:hypothetical protein [Tenacibaculum jejuense]|uniref:Uncharacterized protein n=1 Tax=Tenacibaculum jejuense TaxID=584609 RepID=A0A238UC27_9FLAO|nr:hypothetical protein [Tenacibaculum jejuense]SNR15970.1 protein of unknown function [Tenacibaculum jejuense]